MGFVVFFFAAWLAVSVFYFIPKSLSALENTILYLIMLIISINITWIIIEEYHFIHLTSEGLNYAAYMIHRSILTPMIYVILLNLIFGSTSTAAVWFAVAGVGVMLGLNGLARFYRIWDYIKWDSMYDAVYIVLLLIASVYALKLFRKRAYAEVKHT